ncbi:MAG: hypothetical protein H7287_10045 [Thermoleophilia bacterium]|nr:hypothetical protein [Thermoleophilia bacterium]
METVEHPRRPVRLVDGELVPYDDARVSDCVVWFPVPDALDEGGPQVEGLPAVRIDQTHARLTGVPFFPYHLGLGDEVELLDVDGTLSAVEVTVAARVVVARVFHEGADIPIEEALADPPSDEPFYRILRALAPHGCWFERYSSNYAALSVDVEEWEYVEAFLDLRSRTEGLRYEVATPMRTPTRTEP